MSSSESEESDIELTPEELAEAEARLEAKKKEKSEAGGNPGDIVVELEETKKEVRKGKKYFQPEEFGIELIPGEIGSSLVNFKNATKNYVINEEEFERKMDIGGDFLSRKKVDYRKMLNIDMDPLYKLYEFRTSFIK